MSQVASILLVDDDQAIRKSISKASEKAGCKVDIARNGKQALEMSTVKAYKANRRSTSLSKHGSDSTDRKR